MELLTNDESIHGQFHDLDAFREALGQLLEMRNVARRFGREVYCNRLLMTARPMPDMAMQQALGQLRESERRLILVWLTRTGPFWDDLRRHGAGDWLECGGEIVTETAVGEAAFRTLHGIECGLVSLTPSDWDFSPVDVLWRREDEGVGDRHVGVDNWRDAVALEARLRDAPPPVRSWAELRSVSVTRFQRLRVSRGCFEPLAGIPFSRSAATRMLALLEILDDLAGAFDTNGRRTAAGQRIYEDYFIGENALFSDSSDTEKHDFRLSSNRYGWIEVDGGDSG